MADLLAGARFDGSGSYVLPDGRLAIPVFTGGGHVGGDAGTYEPGIVTEYWVHPKRDKYARTSYDRYTRDGQFLGTGQFADDIDSVGTLEKLAMAGLAVGASLVLGNALGFIGAPGGTAASGGAAAASGQAGPTLSKAALDGTNIFGANSIPGAFDVATVASATTTTAATTAATTTASTGSLATTGATLASTLSKGLSLAGQALGIKTTLDRANTPGIVPGPTGTLTDTDYIPFPRTSIVPGVPDSWLIGGALVAAGAAAFFIAKKG